MFFSVPIPPHWPLWTVSPSPFGKPWGDERSGEWRLRCENRSLHPRGAEMDFLGIVFISVSPSDLLRVNET